MSRSGLVGTLALVVGCSPRLGVPPDGGFADAGASADASLADGGYDAGSDAGRPGLDAGPIAVYVGSGAGHIFLFTLDASGTSLHPNGFIDAGSNPSFLAAHPSGAYLYSVDEATAGRVLSFSIDPATGALSFLNAASSGGSGPAFLSVDPSGRFVLVANYGSATVSVIPIQANGRLGTPVGTTATGIRPHLIVADPSNTFAVVPCLGSDEVDQFLWSPDAGTLVPNTPAAVATATGAGPRHLVFSGAGDFAYLVNETDSTVAAYAFSPTGQLSELQTVSTLPAGYIGPNTGAEVQLHPSGRFLYASNRGANTVAVFSVDAGTGTLTWVGQADAGGSTPRHFSLDPSGNTLLVANQASGTIVAFRVDGDAGTLSSLGTVAAVPAPAYVGAVALPPR